ncbi:hypothetical protein PM082_017043 [Marasmius tenuissimus]|nr:hypothetical protein PM082_017043 [Marasmius tenuissimus]
MANAMDPRVAKTRHRPSVVRRQRYPYTVTMSCGECGYTANRTADLKRHKLTHLSDTQRREASHRCNYCSYSTPYSHNLKTHRKIHMGQRDECCQDCEFRSTDRASLNRHRRRFHSSGQSHRTDSSASSVDSSFGSASLGGSTTLNEPIRSPNPDEVVDLLTFDELVGPLTSDELVSNELACSPTSDELILPLSSDTLHFPSLSDAVMHLLTPDSSEPVIPNSTSNDLDVSHLPRIREVFPAINFEGSVQRFFIDRS